LQETPATSSVSDRERTKKQRNEFFSTSHLSPAQERVLKDEILNPDKHIEFPLPVIRIEKYAPPPPVSNKPKAPRKKYNMIHPSQNSAVRMLDTCTLTAIKLKEIEYRSKNNDACRRSRKNRKLEMCKIQTEEEKLISTNENLQSELDGLEKGIQNLRKCILDLVNVQKMEQEKSQSDINITDIKVES
jgi:hypothetical protein